MSALLTALEKAVDKGELEAWKAALLATWLRRNTGAAAGQGPSIEQLSELLCDEAILAELKQRAPDGPWDLLAAQARSVRGHRQVGRAMDGMGEE